MSVVECDKDWTVRKYAKTKVGAEGGEEIPLRQQDRQMEA